MIVKITKSILGRFGSFFMSKTLQLVLLLCVFVSTRAQTVSQFDAGKTKTKTKTTTNARVVAGTSTDYDGDGVANDIDLDDDNDGILDTNEGKSAISHDLVWLTEFPNTNTNGNAIYNGFPQPSPFVLKNKDTYNADVTMSLTIAFNGNARNPIPSSSGNVGAGSGETQQASSDGGQPNGIEYLVDWQATTTYQTDKNQYATYTFEFSEGVRLNNFDFKDLDREDDYIDALKIKAYIKVGGIDVLVPLNATLGSRITTWNDPWNAGDFFYHATTNANAAKTDVRNFVTFNSGDSKITKIVITATTAKGSYNGVPTEYSRFMFGDLIISTDTDTDRDSLYNFQDNDSDNDGCADAIEAAGTFTASNTDTTGQLTGGVALNGIPTVAGTGQATTANVITASTVAIDANPTDKSVSPGNNTSFSVTTKYTTTTTYTGTAPNTTPVYPATGSTTGMAYQWQVNTGSGFTNIIDDAIYSGSMTEELTLTAVTLAMDGYQYQVIVTNTNNSCANLTSATATLTVNSDSDGDGVLDSEEIIDGTDENDFCDSNQAHATLNHSPSFLAYDCDVDGLSNEKEYGTNYGFPFDSNGNGIPDYQEVNDYNLSNSDDDIEIFNGVSPSSDDPKNNVFTIRNIEKYPNNSVQIFNRWGVLVYEADGYGTGDKFFRGVSEGRSTVSASSSLPEDTYFYALKYVNSEGNTKERSGYLYITR